MWVLDPANSSELLNRLRPHSVDPQFEVIWCGEGWRSLVGDCDDQLRLAFPDYRFTRIEQEHGELVVAAQPRAGESSEPEQEVWMTSPDVVANSRERSANGAEGMDPPAACLMHVAGKRRSQSAIDVRKTCRL